MSSVAKDNGNQPHTIAIRLRIPAFIICCAVLLLAIGWAFILGIMVGREVKADEELGPLAALWPDMTAPMPVALLDDQDTATEGEVIKTEELQYKDSLQATPVAEAPTPVQTSRPATQQQTSATPQTGNRSPQQPATPTQRPATPPQTPAAALVFDYVFQVASFDKQQAAQDLMRRLNQAGISGRMEEFKTSQGATWYRILINYRGGADLAPLNAKLAPFKLSAPLLRKRTEVQNRP